MKRNRHFKPQVFSTEEKLQELVQIGIDDFSGTYGNRFPKYTELMIDFFKKISFYLPDIYDITYTSEEIDFMSRATPGFRYTLWLEHEIPNHKSMVYEEIDECTFSSLTITHREFNRFSGNSISVIHLHDQDGQFDEAIKFVKAIVRNPKVVFCDYFWFDGYMEDLLQESTFSDENIKKAEEAYKYYFRCKQKSSAFRSKYNREVKNLANEICNEYADKIYKLGYGVIDRLHDIYTIVIRTRAKIYYGDKDLYDKFIRDLAWEINKFCEKYITEYGNFMIPASSKYKANFGFTEQTLYLNIFIDGRYFDNYTGHFSNVYNSHCFDESLNKIIYVKRKGE